MIEKRRNKANSLVNFPSLLTFLFVVYKMEPTSSQISAISVNQGGHDRPASTGLLSERLLPGVD